MKRQSTIATGRPGRDDGDGSVSELVHQQRHALCDMLGTLAPAQWSAETLCTGWDAADVAAHLIVREREPWAAPGIVFGGPARALTERRRTRWKARGHQRLVEALRSGPPWPLSGPLGDYQAVEDWIHEQDIRRGGAGLDRLQPEPQLAEELWRAIRRLGARTLALGVDVVIELTDGARHHRLQARRRMPLALPTSAHPDVTIAGPVGELLLYTTGRTVAEVTTSGDDRAQALLASRNRSI
jgi:uncharacterized protein (TIGR03085 family)